MKKLSIQTLKRRMEKIEQEGFLENCWIEAYRPGGSAKGNKSYWHVRSRLFMFDGKKSKHLKQGEVEQFRSLVKNGQELKKLRRELKRREKEPSGGSREALTRSMSNEWYTPPVYIEAARKVMGGIDLDPASSEIPQEWIQAREYYAVADNGLKQPWWGRVWLNPPYGSHTALWIDKTIAGYNEGEIEQAVLLLKPAVGTEWYQDITARFPECRLHKRIRFIDENGTEQASPPHGNSFFYLGDNTTEFQTVFGEFGNISVSRGL